MGQAKARGTRAERIAQVVGRRELNRRREIKAIEQRHNPYVIPPLRYAGVDPAQPGSERTVLVVDSGVDTQALQTAADAERRPDSAPVVVLGRGTGRRLTGIQAAALIAAMSLPPVRS